MLLKHDKLFVWFSSFCVCLFNLSLFVSELFAPSTSELATKRVESLCVNRKKSLSLSIPEIEPFVQKSLKLSQNQISFKKQLSTYLLFKTQNIISPEWPKKEETELQIRWIIMRIKLHAFETRCEPDDTKKWMWIKIGKHRKAFSRDFGKIFLLFMRTCIIWKFSGILETLNLCNASTKLNPN